MGEGSVLKGWDWPVTWVAALAMGAGVLVGVILGVHTYMTSTATPLHTDPQAVPSTMRADPPPAWAGAVERGRQIVRAGLAEQNLPGLSVAVGAGGDLVWAEGFGWADLGRRAPVEPDLPFRIGTASIVLTSAAAGLLLEQERLHLDAEIHAYVPEFPQKTSPVTLRQVMAHTAGIRNDSGDEGPLFGQHCERPLEALTAFADRALLYQPGTEHRYSSYGWIVVSAAVEAVTGEPFHRFMRKQVFEPLAMDDTRADAASERFPDRATSYFPRYSADPRYGLDEMREADYSCYAGASAFLSTPSDLVRFGLAIDSGRLLRPDTIRVLQASLQLPSGEDTGYGLGWDLETIPLAGQPTMVAGHDGELLGGMVSSFLMVPGRALVVAVIANASYADTFGLASQIAEVFSGPATTR
jgi:CubicO group peptidase (beta-lactamase class C family)